jgi:cytochrome c oxidase subunit IV
MRSLTRDPAVVVWLVLVLATTLSWWLGADHGLGTTDAAISLVLVIAFAKTWAVGRWFMELRFAPPALRLAFDAWVLVAGAMVVALYLTG